MDFTGTEVTIDEWRRCTDASVIDEMLASQQRYAARLDDVGDLIGELNVGRILLVVDRGAVAATGAEECLEAPLHRFEVAAFGDFSPNPSCEQGAAAARLAAEHGAEAVVAIGGGSGIDVAKIAALAAPHPDRIDALSRGQLDGDVDPLPIIAIPTTSGTGSEATHFAAIYVDGQKVSVAHPRLQPIAVVLDRRLHQTMPPKLAAVTGLDALGQAMESVWAVGSNDQSRLIAISAGRIVVRSLTESVLKGRGDDRTAMMIGAHLAGQAINISKTTAAHALSYQLTQRFGLAHGHAVALTLGHIGAANYEVDEAFCNDPLGPAHVRRQVAAAAELLDCAPGALPKTIAQLLSRLELPSDLAAAGVDRNAIPDLAGRVDPIRLGNNPRRFTIQEMTTLLERA